MELTIKICFTLYSEYIKPLIKSNIVYNVDNMSIEEIDSEVDIIHMKYILTSIYSISPTSIPTISYLHMKSMIEKYNNTYRFSVNNDVILTNIESTQFTNETSECPQNELVQTEFIPNDCEQKLTQDAPSATKKGWIF